MFDDTRTGRTGKALAYLVLLTFAAMVVIGFAAQRETLAVDVLAVVLMFLLAGSSLCSLASAQQPHRSDDHQRGGKEQAEGHRPLLVSVLAQVRQSLVEEPKCSSGSRESHRPKR